MDLYSKSVFTVIACALVVLCFQNATSAARAVSKNTKESSSGVQAVTICVKNTSLSDSYDCDVGGSRALKVDR